MTYHGYEQHPDSHPERPWWRKTRGGWRRIDILDVVWDEGVASADRSHPLPAPEPKCGQVWKVPGEPAFSIVNEDGPLTVQWFTQQWTDHRGNDCASNLRDAKVVVLRDWPPPNAVLVAGPGAPWEDTSE